MSGPASPPAARRRLRLKDVTLCAADSLYPALAARALELCVARADFADAILFSDAAVTGNFRRVPIAPLKSLEDYSRFCLRDMPGLTTTPFVLVVQWDGYVVDTDAWSNTFRTCDYIGAPIYSGDGNVVVGNGGFSLRSRRLLDALPALPPALGLPEDWVICRSSRPVLEQKYGVRYAPLALASRFAYEVKHPGKDTFVFHGPPNFWRHESDAEVLRIYASLPPRALIGFSFFGLMIGSLQHGRAALAEGLYGLSRAAWGADKIRAEMLRSIPPDLVEQTLAALEEGHRQAGASPES